MEKEDVELKKVQKFCPYCRIIHEVNCFSHLLAKNNEFAWYEIYYICNKYKKDVKKFAGDIIVAPVKKQKKKGGRNEQ